MHESTRGTIKINIKPGFHIIATAIAAIVAIDDRPVDPNGKYEFQKHATHELKDKKEFLSKNQRYACFGEQLGFNQGEIYVFNI